VLGNTFGFFMAYRKPSRRSLLLFLGPGVVMVSVALTISLLQLPAAASAQSIAATVVVNLVATAVIVALLLRLRGNPRAAYRRRSLHVE
jgi:lipopolysaccharide export LptBFGC system permease protein LptF